MVIHRRDVGGGSGGGGGGVLITRWIQDDGPDDAQAETQFPAGLVPSTETVGDPVPTGEYLTLAGKSAELSDYKGGRWSSTSGPPRVPMCHGDAGTRTDLPEVQRRRRRSFLGLNIGDTADDAKEMVEATEVTYDIGRDTKRALFPGFGGIGLPTTALVSPEGEIVDVHTGPLNAEQLSEMVTDHLIG